MEIGGLNGAQSAVKVVVQRRSEQQAQSAANRLSVSRNLETLREAAVEFESLFVNYLLATLRRAIPKSDLFPRSFARDMYESMYDEELAKVIAKAGRLGLAEMIMQQLGQAVYDVRSPRRQE